MTIINTWIPRAGGAPIPPTQKSLTGETEAQFNTQVEGLKSESVDKFLTRISLTDRTRARFNTTVSLVGKTRALFNTKSPLVSRTRTAFTTAKRLITPAAEKFITNLVVISQWFELLVRSVSNLINLRFSDLHPLALKFGDSPLANPYSTVQVSVTAVNASSQVIGSLASLTCVVTFPDGTVSPTYSIGSGITAAGGGVYNLLYTTKMQGINNELWTATDSFGDQTTYLNRTSVTF